MPVSEKQLAANRENARRSTGPRSAMGKMNSRASALKHGLCSSIIVPEDTNLVFTRMEEYTWSLKPQTPLDAWLVDRLSICSLRIERCERIERRIRDLRMLRAEVSWDADAMLAATQLGAKLSKEPEAIVEALRQNPQGLLWLIDRWTLLAGEADMKGKWTDGQKSLAFDLLGTPEDFREDREPGSEVGPDGRPSGPSPLELAQAQIAILRERLEEINGVDESKRSVIAADLLDDDCPELKRLRRYERELYRRADWCLKHMDRQSPHKGPHPDLIPRRPKPPEAEPEPKPAPVPERNAQNVIKNPSAFKDHSAPFDLLPDEIPSNCDVIDFDAILAERKAKARRLEEAKLDRRREKLRKLRA